MYVYDTFDQRLVEERATQFKGQVERRIRGELSEDEFKPLRLQNGLYLQLQAYMLRIAIPYGLLSSTQARRLARITRDYDRGYAHFTTRQNIQLNWPKLTDIPAILEELAEVQMHAIQTSGNCIRNITTDPFAGVARDEVEDPRPYCEILRQWSTFHPEFAFLPRKFKLAVTGADTDRAAIRVHDIGLRLVRDEAGEVGFEYWVGGGQGRTPVLAERLRAFLPKEDLVSYTEAVLRVYNALGRRDNKYKARIKILVKQVGIERFAELVEEEHDKIRGGELRLDEESIEAMKAYFRPPPYEALVNGDTRVGAALLSKDRDLARWHRTNVFAHKVPGYSVVVLSLKSEERPPGDLSSEQLEAAAELADRYSFGRLVVTHRQNLVLTDVRTKDLAELYPILRAYGFATPNVERLTDIVCCPGLDYCDLANARSIPVAQGLAARFAELDRLYDLGPMTLNISGCINACGHHHVGNIGILGIDKRGVEHFQLMLGGSSADDASFGQILGKALTAEEIVDAVENVTRTYLALREGPEEPLIATYRRVGAAPFKEALYGAQ